MTNSHCFNPMKKIYLVFSTMVLIAFACTKNGMSALDKELDKVIGDKSRYILPNSNDLAQIPQSAANPLTAAKIKLGKLLFFDPIFANEPKQFAGRFTFSCASCHVPEAGFRPSRMQGIADGGYGFGKQGEKRIKYPTYPNDSIDAQGARPLAVLNVAFVTNSMWNGSFGSDGVNKGTENMWGVFDAGTAINHERLGNLEGQNIEGLKTHRMLFTPEIVKTNGYKSLFDEAFSELPESDRYNRKTASFALSAYLRALITDEAPFQKWLKGNEYAMTDPQKSGAILFFGVLKCNSCHSKPNLGSMQFTALGTRDLYEKGGLRTSPTDRRNLGRGGFTGATQDMFKFRVPQLYNLGDSGPYFHGGSKETLEDVVRYFNEGEAENPRVPKSQLDPFLKPLHLSTTEIKDLTAFLKDGLRDPNLKRYVPEQVLSGLCFPNNDVLSRDDMKCK
jgi:cytochrome c peroxidase